MHKSKKRCNRDKKEHEKIRYRKIQETRAGEDLGGKHGVKKEVSAMRVLLAKFHGASFSYDGFYTNVPSSVVEEEEKVE